MPKVGSIYTLMALALVASIACSCAAGMQHAHPESALVEKVFIAASLASFASIGCLSAAAQCITESKPGAAASAAPLPESTSDRPVLGLRAWRALHCGDGAVMLQSWHAQHALWPCGREMVAEIASPGIHAFKTGASLLGYIGPEIAGQNVVVGIVALWGTVIEYEGGWTAEKAYPVEVSAASTALTAAVGRCYGCDATPPAAGLARALAQLEAKLRAPEALHS